MEILWLDEPACQQRKLSGGKAAYLSRLIADYRVPPGFCLTTRAFESIRPGEDRFSSELAEKVAAAYRKLGDLCGAADPKVAVRSSAVNEDSGRASFAGQHETQLNVVGVEAVWEAIRRCWASVGSARAMEYRQIHGLPRDQDFMAVLIQQMIPADVSAVIFSANPVTGAEGEILINANWGLCESIVSGKGIPDAYVVRKADGTVLSCRAAAKRTMAVPAVGGIRDVKVPRILAHEPALREAQIAELARLAESVERRMGRPVDVECAFRGGKLYVLQCRPLTALVPPANLPPEAPAEQSPNLRTPHSPIEPPAEFPVAWENPEDAEAYWMIDRMHVPDPVPPLAEPFLDHIYVTGLNFAAQLYDWPFRSSARRVNGFHYWSKGPLHLSPQQLAQQTAACWKKLEAAMSRLNEIWNAECLPEVQRYLNEWEGFNLRRSTTLQLLAHLDSTVAWSQRVWELHFMILCPFLVAMNAFDEMAQDLFGVEKPLDHFRLLQGFDNKSLETDRALWELSRKARSADLVQALEESDPLIPLVQSVEGRTFAAEVQSFLAGYGRRNGGLVVSDPAWIENPAPVWAALRQYIHFEERDPLERMMALRTERERLIGKARVFLEDLPQPVAARFELLLKAAQQASVLQEDHNFWIDQRCIFAIRRVLLEFGRRLFNAGALEAPSDVFFLTLEEMRDAASTTVPPNLRPLFAARHAEMIRFRQLTPPLVLGTNPGGPALDTDLGRAFDKFFGLPLPPTGEPHLLRGYPASAGIARGRARVIRSLAESRRLQRGDILVAEATLPAWTPLFIAAAAIVTDVGGVTSHSAVIAREYNVPAVVGVGDATRRIADGRWIEVDGGAGLVRILSSDL